MGNEPGEVPLPLPATDSGPVSPVQPATPSPSPGPAPNGAQQLMENLISTTPTTGTTTGTGGLHELLVGPLSRFEPPPPPPPGQGFRFDPEGAGQIIREITDLLEGELMDAQLEARSLVTIKPPGDEDASRRIASTANDSGESYNNFLIATVNQLNAFRDALIAVRDGKVQQDADTASNLDNKG